MNLPKEATRNNLIDRLEFEWDFMKSTYSLEDVRQKKYFGLKVGIKVLRTELMKGLLWKYISIYIGKDLSPNSKNYSGHGYLDYLWEKQEVKSKIEALVDCLMSQVESDYLASN